MEFGERYYRIRGKYHLWSIRDTTFSLYAVDDVAQITREVCYVEQFYERGTGFWAERESAQGASAHIRDEPNGADFSDAAGNAGRTIGRGVRRYHRAE